MDDKLDTESKHQLKLADLLEEEEEKVIFGCDNSPTNSAMSDSGSDQTHVMDDLSHQIRTISITEANDYSNRYSAALRTR